MKIAEKCVVVTGGASGIGASLARRFAAEGARGVVVADVAEAVTDVAAEIGGLGVHCDVTVEGDIAALVDAAEARFGPVDLFCSNAGIFVPGGVDATDRDWERSLAINVMGHVYAARALVPRMVERGGGYLLQTASAAGLLTQIGSAPYAVTKHAVVAFAEWLAITYGDQGIKVSVLAPQAVRTAMTAGTENGGVAGVDGMLEPDAVADAVVAGLDTESFLILPHPEVLEYFRRKTSDYDRWLRGMRRLQAQFGDMFERARAVTDEPLVDAAVAAAEAAFADARAELEALVRIPSISAEVDRRADVDASAEATAELLRRHGLEHVHLAAVDGSLPYVIGDWMHAPPGAPTVLLYAHHDVQPPGVVANWDSDPFVPEARDGRLYGRGAADDKAGAVAHAHAVGAWLSVAPNILPCNVRVLIEGEEEIGSPTLHAFLAAHAEELRSDVLVLADAGNWDVGVPGLTYALRGLAAADIELRALDGPQHSGMVGGAIPDPVMALSRVLASLVDENGDPCFDGAFAGLRAPTEAERRPIAGFDDRPEAFADTMGARPGVTLTGDPTTTLHERLWLRPTLTVIGIDGHPIKGSSNQIVARARARISMRIGPGQDAEQVLAGLRAHVEAQVPWGLELTMTSLEGSPTWETDPTGPAFDAARHALHAGFGVEPVLMGVGGSIPFVGPFADAFGGIPALLMGPDDPKSRIHGENESLHLGDWQSLIRSEVHLLAALAELTA